MKKRLHLRSFFCAILLINAAVYYSTDSKKICLTIKSTKTYQCKHFSSCNFAAVLGKFSPRRTKL